MQKAFEAVRHIAVFSLLVFLFFMQSCHPDQRVTVLKLAHVLDVTHSVHKAMVYMAERLQDYSGGSMRVDIYPGGQLGAERELIELLQIGSLAMTKVSSAPLEAFVPEMKIFGIPYLFQDEEHRWRVLNSELGKKLLLAGEPYYLRGLCYYDAGSRSFYTRDAPVRSPADLKGLKIRVMKSITAVDMVQTLGGSATPIPWGELYTSLQQGVVDGAENNPPSFYLSRHYEVCDYYSLDEHTAVPDILLISTAAWSRLTEEQRRWLQLAVDESVDFQRKLWKESSEEALRAVKKAGVTVFYPDKAVFREAVERVYESYRGTPLYDLVKEIRDMRQSK